MSKTKIDCEQAVCLSQELFHAHFSENLKNGFHTFPRTAFIWAPGNRRYSAETPSGPVSRIFPEFSWIS